MQRFITGSFLVVTLVAAALSGAAQADHRLSPGGVPRIGISSVQHWNGVYVTDVQWGTEAARLGLEPGDVISWITVGGEGFSATKQWNRAIARAQVSNGVMRLHIVDVNTGRTVARTTYLENWRW